ncbi:MAG: ATP-binding protein [Haloferacaceae archaeon]
MRAARDLVGPAVVVVLGVGFAATAVWNFGRELRRLDVLWPPVVAAVLGVGLALTVVYAGLSLAGREFDARRRGTVAAWTVGGAVLLAAVSGVTIVVRLAEGRAVEEAQLDLLISAEGGAIAGFVAGSLYAEATRAAARAERARDTLGFLNSTLRHEVLNGVNVIQGWAERLETAGSGEGHPDRDPAAVIADRCDDIADLVEDVRPLTRTLTGSAAVTPVDLSSLVTDRVASFRSTRPEATVTADVPPDVHVLADDDLSHVLSNLLANAVEHSDRSSPTVHVAVAERDGRVRLTVADDGPGVPDDRKEAVFESDTRRDRGFGLYVTRTLVEQYGGDVWVEDNDPRGAAFVVELDRASGTAGEAATG